MNNKSNNAAIMNRDPVLIVEDTKENQDLLNAICRKFGITCRIAGNGAEALELMKQQRFSVYLVDLMMPVMDGREFIDRLKKIEPDAVIIVQTAMDSSETIIEIMRLGVFDYVIKPIDPEMLKDSLYKALEFEYLKRMEQQHSLDAGLKIRNQIEWLSFKDGIRLSGKGSTDVKSIYNLKTTLAQGSGFGTLTTLIDLMEMNTVDNGDTVTVDKQIYKMIVDNNQFCRMQIEGLNKASDIMDQSIDLTEEDSSALVASISEIVSAVIPHLASKQLSITYPDLKHNCRIKINREKISLVIEELIVNAYKYAARGSAINIFTHISEGYFWISVKNDVQEKPYGGIPEKLEKLVLEPFYRIHPPDESAAKFEKIGFGLGLSVADYIMKKHNGLFVIHDVNDLTHDKKHLCVLAEMLLPVAG